VLTKITLQSLFVLFFKFPICLILTKKNSNRIYRVEKEKVQFVQAIKNGGGAETS